MYDAISDELDRARENLAHQIAAAVHAALAYSGKTRADLQQALRDRPPELIDYVLYATSSDLITCDLLADIAWALGFQWNFSVTKIEPQQESATETAG